jgi:hypothetical protein
MSKDISEIMTECWQLLIEYIPRREHSAAAEQFFSYLYTVLSKEELEAIAEVDSDLFDAYSLTIEDNELVDDEDDYEYNINGE